MRQALKIEDMRVRLNALVVAKKFDMQDPDVISLSRELDRLIVEFHMTRPLVCIKWNLASTEVVTSTEG